MQARNEDEVMSTADTQSTPEVSAQMLPHLQLFVVSRGATWLVAPIRGGAVDLADLIQVAGAGRRALEHLEAGGAPQELPGLLLSMGASDAKSAAADADRFLAELARKGVLQGDGNHGEVGADAGRRTMEPIATAPAAALSGPDAEAVARAILGRGLRLRFQARGASMRPQIGDGWLLEVAARPFDALRRGDVALYRMDEHPLVAHRILDRHGPIRHARGDSCARVDAVTVETYLGVVTGAARTRAELESSRSTEWTTSWRRALGLWSGALHAGATWLFRVLIARPLRSRLDRRSWVRALLQFTLRATSGVLRLVERRADRWRRPLDVLRAALMSTVEKDEQRRRLYARRAVRSFTASDENLEAGLTLLEETLLARHPLARGSRVLVLGCGPGRECRVLAQRELEVTGLDRDEAMLERARHYLDQNGVRARLLCGEAHAFTVEGPPFDAILVFSGLYNMLLPRSRRIELLDCARRHLRPGGRVLLTCLSRYLEPGALPPLSVKSAVESLNPEHQTGDLLLLNEVIHVFQHPDELAAEAIEAGLRVVEIFRDQRAYDRAEGRVRSYAVFERP